MNEQHPLARMLNLIAQRSAAESLTQTGTGADCTCARCQSLRQVQEDYRNPEKAAARGSLPWIWHRILTKEAGKQIGGCWSEGRDATEALHRALQTRLTPGGDEYEISATKVGFVPLGRWTGRPLSQEEWEKMNASDPKQIGVQLDE